MVAGEEIPQDLINAALGTDYLTGQESVNIINALMSIVVSLLKAVDPEDPRGLLSALALAIQAEEAK